LPSTVRSKQKSCQRALKSSLIPTRVVIRVFAEKHPRGRQQLWPVARSALCCGDDWLLRLEIATKAQPETRFPGFAGHRPAAEYHPAALSKVDPIRNRPDRIRRIAALQVGRSFALTHCFDAALCLIDQSDQARRPNSRQRYFRRRAPALVFSIESIEKRQCRPDTVPFPYVQSGLRQPSKARIGLTDSSLSPDAKTVGRCDENFHKRGSHWPLSRCLWFALSATAKDTVRRTRAGGKEQLHSGGKRAPILPLS
jgi:hypothetical protein